MAKNHRSKACMQITSDSFKACIHCRDSQEKRSGGSVSVAAGHAC